MVMVDAPWLLARQHRVLHHIGDFLKSEQVAPLFTELTHELAIGGEYPQGQLGAVVSQVGDVRQIGVGDCQRDTDSDHEAHHTSRRQSDQADRKATDPLDSGAPRRYCLLGFG
jgi:hypothetical protein